MLLLSTRADSRIALEPPGHQSHQRAILALHDGAHEDGPGVMTRAPSPLSPPEQTLSPDPFLKLRPPSVEVDRVSGYQPGSASSCTALVLKADDRTVGQLRSSDANSALHVIPGAPSIRRTFGIIGSSLQRTIRIQKRAVAKLDEPIDPLTRRKGIGFANVDGQLVVAAGDLYGKRTIIDHLAGGVHQFQREMMDPGPPAIRRQGDLDGTGRSIPVESTVVAQEFHGALPEEGLLLCCIVGKTRQRVRGGDGVRICDANARITTRANFQSHGDRPAGRHGRRLEPELRDRSRSYALIWFVRSHSNQDP